MLNFPESRSDYRNYVYQCAEGLIALVNISYSGNNEIITYYSANTGKFHSRLLSEFTSANFTPLFTISSIEEINSQLKILRSTALFADTFADPPVNP